MKRIVYKELANYIGAFHECEKTNKQEWRDKHERVIVQIMLQTSPSGSGIDCETRLDFYKSNSNKLVFDMDYHHMNENGYYDGWTQHKIYVYPDFVSGIRLNITGKNRDDIKDYLYDVYYTWLKEEIGLHWNKENEEMTITRIAV